MRTPGLPALPSLRRREDIPFPIVIGPSQDWDGRDGPWSSFALQVGTPPQIVKALVGTGSNLQMVVLPEGCQAPEDSLTCPTLRGGEFFTNESSTWENNTRYSTDSIYALGVESRLGFDGNGLYGFDTLTLDWQGSGKPTIYNQSIAAIATKDFFLGVLGLNPRPTNFSDDFNNPVPSYLQNLRSNNFIPSLSWSYTAGNQYRSDQALGQLILGGYDQSKFIHNDITFPFNARDIVDLSVDIQEIQSSTTEKTEPLLPSKINAYIDSSVSDIWLPIEACKLFEQEFGIVWNAELELYLVGQTQRDNLLARNASIIFTISHQETSQILNISLPYAAFDLRYNYPYGSNPLNYFPLKRAANNTQYTLGRTFFQEAYVTADYERKTFSVSQCNWDSNRTSQIEAILSPAYGSDNSHQSRHLSRGAIAGIAIGVVIVVSLAGIQGVITCKRRRKRLDPTANSDNRGMPKQAEINRWLAQARQAGVPDAPNGTEPSEITSPTTVSEDWVNPIALAQSDAETDNIIPLHDFHLMRQTRAAM
ncbi:hypothetical protein H072_9435 [Dactylellina haptotyla CBS 200.50]|uniref:Peptidase A1 domain-containing protein n=1 Tax=Dactylellina haptotyla (strain CBS 200.50) TaxID=1284197 RepID=S8A1X9_DACHA|nr:hypothetical protein H072_9435 [Dactylellina haptotyla CBS 200.50]